MKKLLYVNQNLQPESNVQKSVAVVGFFQETDVANDHCLDGLNLNSKLINIAFFEPIGHNLPLHQSLELQKKWQAEHYPNYHSTLISSFFVRMAQRYGWKWFYGCWTRSLWNEGYPQYRDHREAAWPHDVRRDEALPNVYVSLVMDKQSFMNINPELILDEYILY